MKAYEGGEEKPVIETTKNAFKIILPNVNAKYEKTNDSTLPTEPPTNDPVGGRSMPKKKKCWNMPEHTVLLQEMR